MLKTWKADTLFPNLEQDYRVLEKLTGETFTHPIPIYRPFKNIESRNDWEGKRSDTNQVAFIREMRDHSIGYEYIQDALGGLVLNHSGYVDIPKMLASMKAFFVAKGVYKSEVFDVKNMETHQSSVLYQEIEAHKVLFCEGPQFQTSFWELPFRLVRGELMDITCDLTSDFIINQGVFMIPKKGCFTVGSTYDHEVLSYEPQASGITNLEDRLKKLFKGDYRIVDKRAGIRPATHDRKPYIGFHPNNKTLGIFNGFGTKGVSLTPHFARHYADVLQNKIELDSEVDVQRVF